MTPTIRSCTALLVALLPASLAWSAEAAETLSYTVPVGTVTRYRTTQTNALQVQNITATSADGSPAPEAVLTSLRAAFEQVSVTTTGVTDSTETVLAVEADGTRVVESRSVLRTTSPGAGAQAMPPSSFRAVVAYRPDGRLEVRELKLDAAGLAPELAGALEALYRGSLTGTGQQPTGLYGRPIEVGQPVTSTTEVSIPLPLPGLKVEDLKLRADTTLTLQGRTPAGLSVVRTLTRVAPTLFKAGLPGSVPAASLVVSLGENLTAGRTLYLADGRISRSTFTTNATLTLSLPLPASGGGPAVTASIAFSQRNEILVERLP